MPAGALEQRLLAAVADRLSPAPALSRLARYEHDPAAFVHDCIRWPAGRGPTAYQDEILQQLPVEKRVAVRGPHGLGKTALDAWVVLWFALTRDGRDWKVPTTASAWRQLTHFLWPEIRKWARMLDWERVGRPPFNDRHELLQLNLKLRTGEAFAVASNDPQKIEGAHGDHLLYLFDEAKIIPSDTFDAAEGAFSGAGADTAAEAYAVATSTPGEPNGRFYEVHARLPGFEDWWTRHVTLDEVIAAGRVSREWAEQRAKQWGVGSAIYQNRVLGEFASSEAEGVVPLAWVEAAVERWRAAHDDGDMDGWSPGGLRFAAVGVDVARSGEDRTVLALRYGATVAPLRYTALEDTMQTAGHAAGVLRLHRSGRAVVDVIGIGAGVVDRLREQRFDVVAFNASEGTDRKDSSGELGFKNKRSAAWWAMRELLDPNSGVNVLLPPDDLLVGDLTAPHWRVTSSGKIQVEAKDDVRKRLGRSTDSADAVIQAFWEDTEETVAVAEYRDLRGRGRR